MSDDAQALDRGQLDVARQAELLELTQDAILVRDLFTSAVTYWNRGAEKLYGFSRAEARGQVTHTLLQTVFPESLAALNEALVRDGHWEGELLHRRRDGGGVVVSSRQAVQRGPDGQPVAILEINTDITERKRAEQEHLRLAAEQRARELAERALGRLTVLQRLTAALSETLTPEQVGAVVMDQGIRALDAQSGRLSLIRPDGQTADVVAFSGYTDVRTPIGLDEPLPTSEVIRTGRPMFAPTFAEVRDRFPAIGQAVTPLIPGALASVPLVAQGRVIGAMTLVFGGDREFAEDDRELMIALATQAAQALERTRLYELSLMIQEDLRRSRDQLAAILGGIAEGVTVQDADGRLIYANDIAARMSGYASAVEFTDAFSQVLQRFELFDEDGNPFAYEKLPGRILLQGGQPGEVVVQFRGRGMGQPRWSILDATPVRDAQGRIQMVVNIFRDITERKRQTDAAAFLAEVSIVLGATLDLASGLQRVADLAVPRVADWCIVDLVGDRGDARPRRMAVAHTESAGEELAEAVRHQALAPGRGDLEQLVQPRSSMTVRLHARGRTFGSMTFFTTDSERVFGPADHALAEDLATRTGLAIDSAQLFQEAQEQANHQAVLNVALRETVEERDRALDDLRKALRTRDEFLASASHDLKNPLASVKATAQLLERRLNRSGEIDADQLRDGLRRIDAIATRAAGLVEELLDQARMQMGRPLDLDRRPVDLLTLVREVVQEQQQATERHTISVESNMAELTGLWDPRRLGRVVSNLLDNAVKYSPEGGPVTVRVGRDRDAAVVEVSDSGIGIPESDHVRIFERFQRARNVEGRIGGTGIGLASARHIVESHGGKITVRSSEGTGATFVIRLPAEAEGPDSIAEAGP